LMDAKRIEAKGRLLAAEAEYLTASGWKPVVVGVGHVKWQHNKHLYDQDSAVLTQKQYDGEEERAAGHQKHG